MSTSWRVMSQRLASIRGDKVAFPFVCLPLSSGERIVSESRRPDRLTTAVLHAVRYHCLTIDMRETCYIRLLRVPKNKGPYRWTLTCSSSPPWGVIGIF